MSRYDIPINVDKIAQVIYKLVELVEKEIEKEMQELSGAVLYDGWTCNNMHFTALIASYRTTTKVHDKNGYHQYSTLRLTLMAISPMEQLQTCDDEDCSNETTAFSTECYVKFMKETVEVFDCDFDEWFIALIGDNISTNKRIAYIAGKPHIGCASHKLNMEVRFMVNCHADLRTTLSTMHDTMREVKSKLKSAAVLRNLTELHPVLDNATRSSGKVAMLCRYTKIHDEILEASNHPDSEFTVNSSAVFVAKTKKYYEMLAEIDVVTKSFQERGRTLASCRADLDTIFDAVQDEKNRRGSSLYGCCLGKKWIGVDAAIVHSRAFEQGVAKIQDGK